eukprot:6888237-Alexandrium_andersonii.AAC.1
MSSSSAASLTLLAMAATAAYSLTGVGSWLNPRMWYSLVFGLALTISTRPDSPKAKDATKDLQLSPTVNQGLS